MQCYVTQQQNGTKLNARSTMDRSHEHRSEWTEAHRKAWALDTHPHEISEQTGLTCSGRIRAVAASGGMGVRIPWEETGGHLLAARAISW